jgi:hypothetical protein
MSNFDFQNMKDQLIQLPSIIRITEQDILSVQSKLNTLDREIKSKELGMFKEVLSEMNDNKPKFTNDKSREAEVFKRLGQDVTYSGLMIEQDALTKERSLKVIEFDYLKRELKTIELLLKLFEVEKR